MGSLDGPARACDAANAHVGRTREDVEACATMACRAILAYIACVGGSSFQRRVPDMPIPRISNFERVPDVAELRARFVREMRDALGCFVEYNAEHVVGVRPVIGARSGAMADWLEAQPAFDELEHSLRGIGIDEVSRHGLGEAQSQARQPHLQGRQPQRSRDEPVCERVDRLGHPPVHQCRLVSGHAPRGDGNRDSPQRSKRHDLGMGWGWMTAETRSALDVAALRIRSQAPVRHGKH